MLDIHTHLYWKSYDADRDEVVRRARETGVKEMLVIGCTVDESRQAVETAEKYEDVFASVGVHPHEFNERLTMDRQQLVGEIDELRKLAKNEKVIAIGECGLDYYSHDKSKTISEEQKAFQKEGFLLQIELASELQLPMIVHCRPSTAGGDAYEDMFDILKSKILNLKSVVLHCYMGDTEVTKKFLSLPNVYFSFTGNITYPTKKSLLGTKDDLMETVKMIPLERIFTETDCPFLTPQSKRGERNEPAYVTEILSCIARLHNVESREIEDITEANYKKVFSK